MNFSHLMMALVIFMFMSTIVTILPAMVTAVRERYKDRMGWNGRELDKFFVHIKPMHIVAASLGAGVLLGVMSGSWILAGTLVVTGLFAPRIVLAIWKDVRSSQFEAQLMDALMLINNAMRSGLDISTGVELVTTNMKPPISEEFGLVLNAYRLGASLDAALLDMTKRVNSKPLDTAVSAILIQRETGGNLIKTFDQLVQTIRDESKLQQKVRALSAQGRTQISFLAVFPWILGGLFFLMSPEMFQPALADPMGQVVIVILVVWEMIGIFVTKKIVTVDV